MVVSSMQSDKSNLCAAGLESTCRTESSTQDLMTIVEKAGKKTWTLRITEHIVIALPHCL